MKGERFSWAQKHKDQTIITWYKSLSTEFPTHQIYNYILLSSLLPTKPVKEQTTPCSVWSEYFSDPVKICVIITRLHLGHTHNTTPPANLDPKQQKLLQRGQIVPGFFSFLLWLFWTSGFTKTTYYMYICTSIWSHTPDLINNNMTGGFLWIHRPT